MWNDLSWMSFSSKKWHQTEAVIHIEIIKNKRTTFFMRQTDSEAEFRLVLA